MLKYYRLFGILGIICGALTLLGFFIPDITGLKISLAAMLPGFLFSSLYIMTTTRHEIETPKINPGYVGLLLSSAPILMFIYSVVIH
jgi:hypothetical protein